MNEDKQAAALARWIDSGGRGGPPEDVDLDALEAAFALRPELAPAPDLDLNALFDEVQEGPFANAEPSVGGEVVPFPVPASLPAGHRVTDTSTSADLLHGLPEATHRPWWRQWATGGVAGTLAAAAAVLIVVSSGESLVPNDLASPLARSQDADRAPGSSLQRDGSKKTSASPAAMRPRPAAEAKKEDAALDPYRPAPDAPQNRSAPAQEPRLTREAPGKSELLDTKRVLSTRGAGLDDQIVTSNTATSTSSSGGDRAYGIETPAQTGSFDDEQQAAYGEVDELDAPLPITVGAVAGLRADADSIVALDEEAEAEDAFAEALTLDPNYAQGSGSAESDERRRQRQDKRKTASSSEESPPTPAARTFNPTDGWRANLDGPTLSRLDGALRVAAVQASQGSPRNAATSLRPYIASPAQAGLAIAVQATTYALQANDPALGLELADLGLSLGGAGTNERQALISLRSDARSRLNEPVSATRMMKSSSSSEPATDADRAAEDEALGE
jgi:hypothetical protein